MNRNPCSNLRGKDSKNGLSPRKKRPQLSSILYGTLGRAIQSREGEGKVGWMTGDRRGNSSKTTTGGKRRKPSTSFKGRMNSVRRANARDPKRRPRPDGQNRQ